MQEQQRHAKKTAPATENPTTTQPLRLRLSKETIKDLTVRTGAVKGGLGTYNYTQYVTCR